MRRLVPLLGLLVLLVELTGCGQPPAASEPAAETRHAVEVAPVAERRIEHRIVASGALEAFETIHLTARVAGVIDKLLVSEGDRVEAGQAVAEIEPERFRLGLASAEASAARALATRDDAVAALKRREVLARGDATLVKEEELAQARARAAETEADVAAANAALERARLDLRDARVTAPSPGVIQARLAESGQYAQPGTPIATLMRRDPLRLRFGVPAEEARLLRAGQVATFRARGADAEARAEIIFIAAAAEPTSRQITVIARVQDAREDLRPGAFAEVELTLPTEAPAPVAPETAVRPSERGFLAYVIEDGKLAHERRLTLGLRSQDGLVEVRDGLKPGESVVVRGAEALAEGARVRVVEPVGPVKAEAAAAQ